MPNNIVLTGMPGSGKSTLLKRIVRGIPFKTGFVTNEILGLDGKRTGFEIEASTGRKVRLASTTLLGKTEHSISRYGVKLDGLEAILPEVSGFNEGDLLYLDEIGAMQLFSPHFERFARGYLDARNICLTTLKMNYKHPFVEEVKRRPDTFIFTITPENREQEYERVKAFLKKVERAGRYVNESGRFFYACDGLRMQSEHGVRTLQRDELNPAQYNCDCDFYGANNICSHGMAWEKILDLRVRN